jgi:general secretion pathway protein G
MRNRVNRAFTLVEILIVVVILGILAAIVIPQFTSASEEAQVGNVQTQLQTVRSQIELFRVRNNGISPVLEDAANPFTDLLCGTDNNHGLPVTNSENRTQSPYMKKAPVNPRNGLDTVAASADPETDAAAADAVTAAIGWYYDVATGTFAAAGFDESTNTWVPVP